MKIITKISSPGLGFLANVGILLLASSPAFAEKEVYLHQIQRIGGVVISAADGRSFLVGSDYGALSVAPDGRVTRLSKDAGFLTELIAHPRQTDVLFSSGYRSKTEKLGVIRSDDAGRTWSRISDAAGGPVAFHAMAISAIEPSIIYGAGKTVQISRDGGKNWRAMGRPPGQIYGIALSTKNPKSLYAATHEGLFGSMDEGATWTRINPATRPATAVTMASNGQIYAFVYGIGLLVGSEPGTNWNLVSKDFQDRALVNISVDTTNPTRLLGVADTGAVMLSRDGGKNWISFEGQLDRAPQRISAGEALFNDNCQACHGAKGIGEKPDDPRAVDENGFPLAPALNDDAHGWHHGDDQLMATILNGSPRNKRMAAWKDGGMTSEDARNLVAYIKSLWNFRSLACQGGRHMRCMH